MNVLLVYATPAEAAPLFDLSGMKESEWRHFTTFDHPVDVLLTGAGSVATAYSLGRHFLNHRYDLAINAGICGSFSRKLLPGTVVNIVSDCFADFGAEDDESLLDAFEIGIAAANTFPFKNGKLYASPLNVDLLKANGITVNRSSGNETTIRKLKEKYHADTESMEGAAFLYACNLNDIPCLQIRSVSNVIERRNKSAWQLEKAIQNLSASLEGLLNTSLDL